MLLVFDATSESSVQQVTDLYQEIVETQERNNAVPAVVFVGNKADYTSYAHEVSLAEAKQRADNELQHLNVGYVETSAATGRGSPSGSAAA